MQEEINNELWNRNERIVHQVQPRVLNKEQEAPDPKLHQLISFIKSGIRIAGYICIPFSILAAVILLVISEVIGIVEELV